MITINYASIDVFKDEYLSKCLLEIPDIRYFVFQLEQAKTGTYHHHILCCFTNAKSFDVMSKKFPRAHLEPISGSVEQTRKYCTKDEGRIRGPIEYGTPPQQGKRTDLEVIHEMIEAGESDSNIRKKFPVAYIKYHRNFKSVRQEILEEKYASTLRDVEVTYIYGDPGTGKTRYVLEKHSIENVYRITDYLHPFDQYQGEDVIVFEEFRSSLKIEEMLHYLDIYPLRLPARYENRVACYTKIYIITNIPLDEQYKKIQQEQTQTYQALLRRINKGVMHFKKSKDDNSTKIVTFKSPEEFLRHQKRGAIQSEYHPRKIRIPKNFEKEWFDEELSEQEFKQYYLSASDFNTTAQITIEELLKQ